MVQNIEIFIINLARSKDRYESMRRKIAKIRGFSAIYIDGEKIAHQLAKDKSQSLPLPCGGGLRGWVDSSLRGRIADSPEASVRSTDPHLQIQNKNQSARSANPCKSFCYFWLSPKVESPLPLSLNLLSNVVSTQSAEITLHFHFFDATDATKLKNGESPLPPQYSSKLTRFVKGKDLSFGEIACFSSHYRLWEKCVALDSPIVVLEDDIDFMQDFCQIVEITKSPFEYVRLYYLFNRKMSQIYGNFYISFGNVSGGQGYYLTPKAARKFIKNARFWLFCVDDYMDMFFIHSVKNIIFLPFIITEDSANATQSTIVGREKPKMQFYQKLTRELSRIYFFVIRKALYFALNCIEIRANFWAKQNRR